MTESSALPPFLSAAPTAVLDARGLKCPLPVLKTRKRLAGLASGEVLEVWADDPAAVIDLPHYCQEAGHALLGQSQDGARGCYWIRKSG